MPSKKKRGRNIEIDEYIPDPLPHVPHTEEPAIIQERHTHYELHGRAVHSLLTVPASPPSTNPYLATNIIDSDTVDEYRFEYSTIEDIDEDREHDTCELEALGLGEILSQTTSLQENDRKKRQRTQADNPLLMWVPHIDIYVSELLRLEGLGDALYQSLCAGTGCNASIQLPLTGFRCKDCQDLQIFCLDCILSNHRCQPFHRIQTWNGTYFDKVLLKTLGLRIQLGHTDGPCLLPCQAFNDDFTIIDSDGIHEVALDYCGCQLALPKTIQLLRFRLFPSTVIDPKTAATFRVLETFQMLSFTSKVSGYEYYRSLARRTDNTGTLLIPDRYHAFMRMVREWRHVRLLKRMGRGHAESGVKGTKEGECAVLCPACPIPDVNLPPGWQEKPESEQWLYSLFVGLDANFRLKRMNVSSDERDPGLNHGYAYVVENRKFKNYLLDYDAKIPDDKSTCNNHDAIKSASMRGGKGTDASGMGTTECSRHDMKCPTAVGDLQRGERYVNMDYFFLSTLKLNPPLRLVVSYDIACQWSKNLDDRCQIYPPNPISSGDVHEIVYLVPKFHLPAHILKCQVDYSFNLVPRVGRTDGEAPERGWSYINGVASSTKEMGPGSRRDTLDDHFGDYNWRKIAQIADTFIRKSEEAITSRQEHVDAFVEFSAALPAESVLDWTKLCQKWEKDRTKQNPFMNLRNAVSEAEVRLRLAQEDADELAKGKQRSVHEDVSPSMLICQGLELEDLQRRHIIDVAELGPHSTSLQQAKVLERSNMLRRKIEAWIEIQHLYIPGLSFVRACADRQGGGKPPAVQDIDLFLPSQILNTITCDHHLLTYEWQLRYAQAEATLNDIRGLILMRSHMYKSKSRHSRGQRQQTRSLTLLNRLEARIKSMAAKYRKIREALIALSTPLLEFTWTHCLRVLDDSDLVGLTSMDGTGSEGRKKLTWIWNIQGIEADSDKETQAALRVEWCRARARAHRWQEECLLLNEEMRRVTTFFGWQVTNWKRIGRDVESTLPTTREVVGVLAAADIDAQNRIRGGKIAYAHQQASIREKMKMHCENKWRNLSSRLLHMEDGDALNMIEYP